MSVLGLGGYQGWGVWRCSRLRLRAVEDVRLRLGALASRGSYGGHPALF